MISLNLFITIIGILVTIILFLVGYIIHTWKRESVLSAKNNNLNIERSKSEQEANKLKDKIINLEKEKTELISNYDKHFSAKAIRDKYIFNDKYGFYESKGDKHSFCASCLLNTDIKESPLKSEKYGWRCPLKNCHKFYPNELYSKLNNDIINSTPKYKFS